jgi:hypothetical protein
MACFGLVSVVNIALAKSRPALDEAESFAAAFEIPAVIFSIGNCFPIMPVEATRIFRGSYLVSRISVNERAVWLHIVIAFSIPFRPVQVLALPELTTTAYILELLTCSLLTWTAAETTLLVVKTAAAFAPAGHTSSAKSDLPDFLIPHCTPAAKNPSGAVIVLLTIVFSLIILLLP